MSVRAKYVGAAVSGLAGLTLLLHAGTSVIVGSTNFSEQPADRIEGNAAASFLRSYDDYIPDPVDLGLAMLEAALAGTAISYGFNLNREAWYESIEERDRDST